jgi:two-component system, OmpR family, sensor histidine kinase MtrB
MPWSPPTLPVVTEHLATTEQVAEEGAASPGPAPAAPAEAPRLRLRDRLGLRARATVAFGCVALALSGMLSVLAYELARSYLIEQRQTTATRQAYVNARLSRSVLRTAEPDVTGLLSSLQSTSNSVAVLRFQGRWFASSVGVGPDQIPTSLRQAVLAEAVGRQRFRLDGVPHVAVGVPLPAADAFYFELVPLSELTRTLDALARAFAIGAIITVLGGAAVGRYLSGRILRPLGRMAHDASSIASGELDRRLDSRGDVDLGPLVVSFNEMVDTLAERIDREARFASDVSHELRTPLAAMTAAINVARRHQDSPQRMADALDALEVRVNSFNRLVLNLLEISRLEAGMARLEPEPVEVERFLRVALTEAGKPGLSVGVEPGTPTRAWVDSRRVSQMLVNLLENADKYAGGATGVVVSGGPGLLRIAVEDRGPGIPEHERTRVFERFARGETANRSGGGKGTGLGLSLVAEHARLHSGRVWVEDRPGGGARFVIELPAGHP